MMDGRASLRGVSGYSAATRDGSRAKWVEAVDVLEAESGAEAGPARGRATVPVTAPATGPATAPAPAPAIRARARPRIVRARTSSRPHRRRPASAAPASKRPTGRVPPDIVSVRTSSVRSVASSGRRISARRVPVASSRPPIPSRVGRRKTSKTTSPSRSDAPPPRPTTKADETPTDRVRRRRLIRRPGSELRVHCAAAAGTRRGSDGIRHRG